MNKVVIWILGIAVGWSPAVLATSPAIPSSPAQVAAEVEVDPDLPRLVFRPGRPDSVRGRVAATATTPKRVRILVLPAYWGSTRPEPSVADIKGVVLGEAAAWFARVSRGRHRVRGRVTPYLKIKRAPCSDDYAMFDLIPALKRKARARGIGVNGYNRFMAVTPQCRTNSLGSLPGPETWIRDAHVTADVVIHELGHNLGLEHAGGLICQRGDLRITVGSRKECHVDEYGDLYDAMGVSSGVSTGQFSVPRLRGLGWAGRTQSLSGSGTVTLAPAENSGDGVQGLRVKVNTKRSYWVEYRTDSTVAQLDPEIVASPGVQVRLQVGRKQVQVLDAFPGEPDDLLLSPDGELPRVELPAGSSFTTPEGIRITTVSAGETAVVSVQRGAPRPGVPVAPLPTVAYGGDHRMHVAWQRVLEDNGAIVRGYRVRDGEGEVHVVRSTGGLTSVLETTGERAEGGAVAVQAFNEVGDSEWSAPVAVASDAPTARFLAPSPGAVVEGRFVLVQVEATPNPYTGAAISSVSFQRDGSRSFYAPYDVTPPYEATLELYRPGESVLDAHVCDAEGVCIVLHTPIVATDPDPGMTLLSPVDGQVVGAQLELRLRIKNNITPLERLWVDFGGEEQELTGQFTGEVALVVDTAVLASGGSGSYSLSISGVDDDHDNDQFRTDTVTVELQP